MSTGDININSLDLKKKGLIISYCLSRCDKKAVSELGYSSFSNAFNEIGEALCEKPSNIKNMRDEFDPYFNNPRVGWYQRGLRASRKEVFELLKDYSDDEVINLARKIITSAERKEEMSQDTGILKNLRSLIRQSKSHFNSEFSWEDVELNSDFKDLYREYLKKNKYDIEYNTSTSVITTPMDKTIFMPNQWFVIASYAVGVNEELQKYKSYFEKITIEQGLKAKDYAVFLRDEAKQEDKFLFIECSENVFSKENSEYEKINQAANRLWRFTTDYSWWSGQKTIDRTDFHYSVVLNMLNLVNASQSYVADIVEAYSRDSNLKRITASLEGFTNNLEGITYDFNLLEEPDERKKENELSFIPTPIQKSKVTISISKDSITKLHGR